MDQMIPHHASDVKRLTLSRRYVALHFLAGLKPGGRSVGDAIAKSLWIAIGMVGQVLIPAIFVVLAAWAALMQGFRKSGNTSYAGNSTSAQPPGAATLGPSEVDLYETWKSVDRREGGLQVDTTRWSLNLLKAIEWKRLETLCAAYFETLHFRSKVCGVGADGGVDIHLTLEGEAEPKLVVQCKSWKTWKVGVKPVRELLGVMTSSRISEGVFVTTSEYTDDARQFAAQNNIHLIDGPDLLAKILATPEADQRALLQLATEGDFTTPTCPSCGLKMVERTATKSGDSFWGCRSFPRCRTTLQIGAARV